MAIVISQFGAVLSELARQALAPADITERAGLPVLDVDDDAPPITPRMIAAALDDQ